MKQEGTYESTIPHFMSIKKLVLWIGIIAFVLIFHLYIVQ